MRTAVIVLNWNGCGLLLECLESLLKAKGDFFVVVADNASTDSSAEKTIAWLGAKGVPNRLVHEGDEQGVVANGKEVIFYSLKENYGFAKGNNIAVSFAMQSSPQRLLLLNNDTEVEPDFLTRLEAFQHDNPKYKVLTPLIFFNSDRNKIWNAGGKLSMGFRKYYYANQGREAVKEPLFKPVTFITGCALYFSPDILDADGKILTERFFFGEEDFEFSIRMKRAGVKMACVMQSVIYHKVGSSINKTFAPGKFYIHYLNRFIDVRLNYGGFFYGVWSAIYKPYMRRLLKRQNCPSWYEKSFLDRIYRDARNKDCVTAKDFRDALQGGWSGVVGRPLRVLIMSDSANDHTKRWVRATAERGVEVMLFSLNDKDKEFYSQLSNVHFHGFSIFSSIKNKRKNGAFEKLRYLKTVSALKRCIKEFQPDILHAHYASSYGLIGSFAKFSPFVISLWGSDVYSFPRVSPLHRYILRRNFRKADILLSTSNCMAEEASLYTDKNLGITPFGIDVDRFIPLTSSKSNDEYVVATVKNLAHVYGVDTLVEAFALVCKGMPGKNVRLLIAGGGDSAALEARCKELGIADRVTFLGKIPNESVPELLANVDVFAALSRKESFGVAALEAMACGKPVVVSDADGFKEIIEDGKDGFIVPKENPEAAAGKILQLLNDRELIEQIGCSARESVVAKYSWKVSVDTMMGVYDNIICKK